MQLIASEIKIKSLVLKLHVQNKIKIYYVIFAEDFDKVGLFQSLCKSI
jgi:hypothetical protein